MLGESRGIVFEEWLPADRFELVVAADEEAFDDTLVPFSIEEVEDDWDDCGEPTTIFPRITSSETKRWKGPAYDQNPARSVLEVGKEMHEALELALQGSLYNFDEVTVSIGGTELKGDFTSMSFKTNGSIEAEFVGRPALPPPAPAAVAAGEAVEEAVKKRGWRMFYDNSSARRKDQPVAEGFLDYFPATARLVAELSRLGNEKHNPGQELHHARGKSTDHRNCVARHLMSAEEIDEETELAEAVCVVWRASAFLQELCERKYGWPLAPRARLPEVGK